MKVELSTVLRSPPARIWYEVQRSQLLRFVSAPVLCFARVGAGGLPEQWEEGECQVSIKLFGVLPLGKQTLNVSRQIDGDRRSIRDDGSGTIARVWDHRVTVEPLPGGHTRYTDQVEVEAGILTPAVWAFAAIFYRHRQRRWRRLVRTGFSYES